MDARAWNGADTRDFDADWDERCADCGVGPHELCLPDCDCHYCNRKRAREAAILALDVLPEEVA